MEDVGVLVWGWYRGYRGRVDITDDIYDTVGYSQESEDVLNGYRWGVIKCKAASGQSIPSDRGVDGRCPSWFAGVASAPLWTQAAFDFSTASCCTFVAWKVQHKLQVPWRPWNPRNAGRIHGNRNRAYAKIQQNLKTNPQ